MKRRKTISVKHEYADVKITIAVDTDNLTREEADRLACGLTEQTMIAITRAPWMANTLHKMRIT